MMKEKRTREKEWDGRMRKKDREKNGREIIEESIRKMRKRDGRRVREKD